MKTMAAGQFKAKCLQIMDQVNATRTPLVITKRGKPVVKLVPVDEARSDVFDCLKGQIEILGDIVSPVASPDDWEALK